MASDSSSAAPGVVDRVAAFVSENRRAVLLGAAVVVAAGGVAYYAASTSHSAHDGSDAEQGRGKDKKKSKSKKKGKSPRDKDGPILEEREPKPPASRTDAADDEAALTPEEIAALSEEDRAKAAASLKARGNSAYQQRKFAYAADLYTRAIEVSPKPEPVFYSNRAACYVNMSPPKHDLVIADCDVALSLDKTYVKALSRRATAHEQLGDLEHALRDFTSATILDKFQNEAVAQAVERVLKKLAAQKATEILESRERRLPSFTFVSAYFAAFRSRPLPTLPDTPTTGDNTLLLGMQALEAADYTHAFTLVNESLEQDISWDVGRAHALNLRGTFKFLVGDVLGAKEDLLASIALLPTFTQSWVKIASVYMEQGDPKQAFECFEEAIKHDSKDPDIYYHRGQVLFIMNEFQEAAANYTQSTELDGEFVFSHIQLAVAQYKSGDLAKSMVTFRKTLREFPQRSEPQNYYGELLLDQGRFQEAVEKFERAFELEKAKTPPMNVLSLVNKGLALYQWKQDLAAAERCCYEALHIDAECEAAVATLAQLSLQQGKIERAVDLFHRQSELARSEPELVNALTYQYASSAQLDFVKEYPEMGSQLNQIARSMI